MKWEVPEELNCRYRLEARANFPGVNGHRFSGIAGGNQPEKVEDLVQISG